MQNINELALSSSAAAASTQRASASAALRASEGIQVVDLSGQPARAQIVRQGYDVPAVAIDQRRVDQIVGGLTQVPAVDLPRVLSQSVAAGTKVPVGTAVDLVLASRHRIPFNVFGNAHVDLANRNLDAIDPLLNDAAARNTLLTYSSANQVPAADRTRLITALQNVGVGVDDNDPNRTFGRAFDSARGALAFQG